MKAHCLVVLTLIALASPVAARPVAAPQETAAEMAPPQPPAVNPHPPQTAEDQRRVTFAGDAIKGKYGPQTEIRHPHVIPWSFEKFKANQKGNSAAQPPAEPPAVAKMAPGAMAPMPAPQLKPDEYMVHAYVKFTDSPAWYHVDVIMSEDADGKLVLRDFFKMAIPQSPSHMPPGVVC